MRHKFWHCVLIIALSAGAFFGPAAVLAQEGRAAGLPSPVKKEYFARLKTHSPFRRTLNVSKSLILTGVSSINDDTVATVHDLDTRQTYLVSESESNNAGWQLVELKGDRTDLDTLTARIKVDGAEVVSIRYEKAPPPVKTRPRVMVSSRIGNGSRGGGTGPHGGPDPRVLTHDQLSDARNAARNIRSGFQADGYADGQPIPPETLSKISRLSVNQRESINVKMFEYRNRGLGMKERQKIYNGLLDKELRGK